MKLSFLKLYVRHFYIYKKIIIYIDRTVVKTHKCKAEIEACILKVYFGFTYCLSNRSSQCLYIVYIYIYAFDLINAIIMTAFLRMAEGVPVKSQKARGLFS